MYAKKSSKTEPDTAQKRISFNNKKLAKFLTVKRYKKRAKLLSFFDTQNGYSFGNENLKIKGNASRQNGQL